MTISKPHLIKGGVCGIILSCLNNLFIILDLYGFPFEFVSYGIAIISAILAVGFFINEKITKTVSSFFISIILFFITEIVVSLTGIIRIVFKHIHGASVEMWVGDGFGMLVILMFTFTGYLMGSLLVLVF